MEDDVRSKLLSFRARAEAISGATRSAPRSGAVASNLIAGAAGKVAAQAVRSTWIGDLIAGQTAGSAVRKALVDGAKAQAKEARMTWNATQDAHVTQLVAELETYLKGVSIAMPSLTPRGNSERLLRKLGRVHRARSARAKGQSLVSIIDEVMSLPTIPNERIPGYLAEREAGSREEAISLITVLEDGLRGLVRAKLSKLTPDWWLVRIPDTVRSRAEGFRRRDEMVYPKVAVPDDPLSYVSFRDYKEIIATDPNWKYAFEAVFRDRAWTAVKLEELEPIRNAVMHSRRLTGHGLEKLKVTARDLMAKLQKP